MKTFNHSKQQPYYPVHVKDKQDSSEPTQKNYFLKSHLLLSSKSDLCKTLVFKWNHKLSSTSIYVRNETKIDAEWDVSFNINRQMELEKEVMNCQQSVITMTVP